LKRLADAGHSLILYTMRCDGANADGRDDYSKPLSDAVNWFKKNDIPLYGIQSNPTQREWTTSPKCYAQLYIDDAALGCPLIHGQHERPYVDWDKVNEMLFAA